MQSAAARPPLSFLVQVASTQVMMISGTVAQEGDSYFLKKILLCWLDEVARQARAVRNFRSALLSSKEPQLSHINIGQADIDVSHRCKYN
jgi:hypothetical protein